ncbi:MAG: histidinol-phosphatase HisJ family protein [Coriobacteriia bacterium]|nr:histidinol-phosphatase HisJ family protein [Coriobacteriia bacterium]
MRELIDCHIHTQCCGHATGSVSQAVDAALSAGLIGIVMTEHLPLPDALNTGGLFAPSAAAFLEYARVVREQADSSRGLQIVLGAEADWLPGHPEAMQHQLDTASAAGVEVLLGSVHFLGEWPFDSPDHLDEWERQGADAVWESYFATWCVAARSGRFGVMAHPDLPKKFGHKTSYDPSDLYREAAVAAREGCVMVEVSTGGLRKPVGEIYPGPALLAHFADQGVAATAGSDAHSPAEVGFRIDAAYEALVVAGFDRVGLPMGGGEVRWVHL